MSEHEERPTLGTYLRDKRRHAGLSARQLASEAGTTASNISRIESGETPTPTPELLKRIAEALELDLAELFGYRGITVQRTVGNLRSYLRQEGVPDEGIAEAEEAVLRIARKYGGARSRIRE